MKKVPLSCALITMLLLAFTATAAAQPGARYAYVPAVTGKPQAEAQRILANSRLNAQVTQQPVAQPQGRGKLQPSAQPAEVIMPDTIGTTLVDAQNALVGSGITRNRIVVHERVVRDPRFSAGIVQSQKPTSGAKVPYHPTGQPVELWVDIFKR